MPKNLYDLFKKSTLIVTTLLIFCFIYFQKLVNEIITKFLMCDPQYNRWYLKLLVFCSSAALLIMLYNKLIKLKYIPSAAEYFFISIAYLILLCYRLDFSGLDWNLHNVLETGFCTIKYLDLPLALITTFYCFSVVNVFYRTKKNQPVNNFLIGDSPISEQEEDKLDHTSTVERLTEILLNEQHPKSISIGLVGPWGNGKSSVIQMVKNKVELSDPYKDREIISIHFLPYLNHNENDIINEFFTTLSNEIAVYSGRLSNQLLDYSQKLTDLYQNKSIIGFLENQVTNFSKLSASQLYQDINDTLEEVDKKIIIFVDDLDRLNQNEILQTLKLIRNTANFRNTFFVVAMDMGYVIKRLREKGNILDTKFVDKFFQLEVYLPEIDNAVLKKYFITELLTPFSPSPDNFEELLTEALNSPFILFEYYVKNFRDAKRYVNQIKYDLSLFREDFSYLNLKDFINFTFLKLKFPSVIKQLNDNMGEFLEIDSSEGAYKLIQIRPPGDGAIEQTMEILNREKIDNIEELKKYIIYDTILQSKKKNRNVDLKINKGDKKLLIKTLAFLFGDENRIEAQDSIKYISNFQMLVQQRIFTNYFRQSEFDRLYIIEYELLKSELLQIKNEGKIPQLLDRLKYLSTEDIQKLKRTIEYSILVYENRGADKRYDNDNFKLINKFTGELYQASLDKPAYKEWINQSIFSNNAILVETRLNLLGTIWKIKHIEELWYLDEQMVISKAAELYESYMDNYANPLVYDKNAYQIYGPYHAVKNIAPTQINKTLKDFWKKNKAELLCTQLTELESFSNSMFKISDTAVEIFGSKSSFIEFVKSHDDHELDVVQEFLALYKLLQIIDHSAALRYDFTKSEMMMEKVRQFIAFPGRERYADQKPTPQVIVKITNKDLGNGFLSAVSYADKYQCRPYIYEDAFYLKIEVLYENIDYVLSRVIDKLLREYEIYSNFDYQNTEIRENTKIELSNDNYIEFVSIKPQQEKIKYIEGSSESTS